MDNVGAGRSTAALNISLAAPSLLSTYIQGDILFGSCFVVLICAYEEVADRVAPLHMLEPSSECVT